jgi:anti-sigma regulatory factor (Ser/Thr protein kinase)
MATGGASSDECEIAALLVSELVSNAVLHTTGASEPIELVVRSGTTGIHIEVQDHDPSPPVLQDEDPMEEHGAGLRIVDQMSARWGWGQVDGNGKHVWCEMSSEGGTTG